MSRHDDAAKCPVVENYLDYEPPVPAAAIVRDLLRCVDLRVLAGLHAVVLTNAAALSRRERRCHVKSRKHKVALAERRGFYAPATREEPAYIELKADMIIARRWRGRRRWLADPWIYRVAFGHVLYHEIGHHIHATQRPENGEKERVADAHMWRLLLQMARKRWYLFLMGTVVLLPGALPRFIRVMRYQRSRSRP